MADRVVLTIGTRKGVFVAGAATPRRSFALRGPFGPGVPVYSTLIDTRGTPRLYASSCNPFFGMKVLRSTDIGKSFKETKSAPAFPKADGRALANIWSLEVGGGKKELWCGVEPASLFRSHDGGDSWDMVPGISNHEHARKWQPGAGGLCMHTIIRDGNRVHLDLDRRPGHRARTVARRSGRPIKASAGFAPDPYPEFGQCVHKIARHDDAPGRLYMQNHGGWSEWTTVAAAGHRRAAQRRPRPVVAVDRQGIAFRLRVSHRCPPAGPRHGVRHAPRKPATRSCPGAAPAVWRSENGGDSC